MPELPDLEVFARNLSPMLVGRRVERLEVHRPKRVREPEEGIERALVGRTFCSVRRVGKEVWFELDDGRRFSVHLMLDGAFYHGAPGDAPRLRAVTMHLDDGSAFGYVDPRGLAILQFDPKRPSSPDALELSLVQFQALLRKKAKHPIKALLVDQEAVGGIGNAFADEILWEAGIHPNSICGELPDEMAARLFECIRRVLERAIEQIGKRGPEWIGGEERSFLNVHVKDRETTPTGHRIQIEEIAGKRTYFTGEQVLYR